MKNTLMLLAAGLVASVLAACANVPTQTPAQIAQNICPGVQAEIYTLQQSGVFTGGAQATLTNQVQPDVAAVCAAGASATDLDIRKLVQSTFPVVVTAIANAPLTDQQKLQATLAVGVVVTGINTALSLQPNTSTTTPPATAPVAASSTVISS